MVLKLEAEKVAMAKSVVLALAVIAAGASQAGWESWLKSDVYRASFETYSKDEALSNKGATNGTWSVADAEATAASDPGSSQYINFLTGSAGIAFTPATTGNRALKSVLATMQLSAYEDDLPDLSEANPRGALAIHAPEDGETAFIGWTDGKWIRMQAPSVEAVPGTWYDISMKFVDVDGVVNVQYRVKKQDDTDYETLHAADDPTVVMFKAGGISTDTVVGKIEFRGEGAFSRLSGSEPRRGLLIGLVPWREMLIDESVYHKGQTGDWYVFDYDTEQRRDFPLVVDDDTYVIYVPEGEKYAGFKPKGLGSGDSDSKGREVIEFTVRFVATNDNDAAPTNDVCALVRLVELPVTNVMQVALDCQFACLANGGWHTNTNPRIHADVDTDYTVEITLDRNAAGTGSGQTVSYRIKQGRGAEAGAYQDLLMNVPVAINDPLFTLFGGLGKVYNIKAVKPTDE